jgi:hypothetical protein
VTLFSDSCIGQNRSKFVASALLHAVCTSTYLKVVNHKFLGPEHTQMECDSIHSAMEYAKRKTNIYVPSQWNTIASMTRRGNPYTVIPVRHPDIVDFKKVHIRTITAM